MNGWIGVDLDGTLALYDEWRGAGHVGAPIMPMLNRVRAWLNEGKDVRIFTARVSNPAQKDEAIIAISEWCMKWFGQELPITNVKDYGMIELWDDRAVQVYQNTGIPVGRSTRGLS